MNVIEKKTLRNLRYLCGSPDLVKSRYEHLKHTFGENYSIFAEPIYISETNTIIWTTNQEGKPINFTKLTQEDQALTKSLLRQNINALIKKAKTYQDTKLIEFLFNCIEVPSMENVFLIKNNNPKVILTFWGFVSDDPDSQKGLLAKIIEVKKIPIVIQTVYHDTKKPAPNKKIIFEYENNKKELISDENGKIIVENIPIDTKFIIKTPMYEKEKVYEFYCYEGGNYTVETEHLLNPVFKTIYSDGKIATDEMFIFEYNDKKIEKTSDNQGIIILHNIKPQTTIKAYQKDEKGQRNLHEYTITNEKEYILKIAKKVHIMKILAVDKKNQPVPEAEITVIYEGKKEKYISDKNGYIYIKGIQPGTKVKIIATKKKKK